MRPQRRSFCGSVLIGRDSIWTDDGIGQHPPDCLGQIVAVIWRLFQQGEHGACACSVDQIDSTFLTDLHLATQGMPSHVIAITIGFYRAARAGEFANAGPALTDFLGNEPTDLRKVLADMM